MILNKKSLTVGIFLFVFLNGIIDWYIYSLGTPGIAGWYTWEKYGVMPLAIAITLIPGFVTGYMSKTKPFINGLIVAVVGSLIIALGPTFLYLNYGPYFYFVYISFLEHGVYCILMSVVGAYIQSP